MSNQYPPQILQQRSRQHPRTRSKTLATSAACMVACATTCALLPHNAHAAGFYTSEIGAQSVSRGGAVIVNPEDASAVWLNPAAITLAPGLQLQLNGTTTALFSSFTRNCGAGAAKCGPVPVTRDYGNGRVYTVDDNRAPPDDESVFFPDEQNLGKFNTPSSLQPSRAIQNQAAPFTSPSLFATYNLGTEKDGGLAFGLGIFGPNSGDYQYDPNEVTRYTLIDRDLLEAYYMLSVAYRYQNWIAIGISAEGVAAGVRQTLKLSADQGGNENPDFDLLVELNTQQLFTFSANAGIWSNPIPNVEIGASVQLPRYISASGPLAIKEKGPGVQELIDNGLVTIQEDNPTATTEFKLPPFYRAGVKYKTDTWDVELDAVYEQWSFYDHVFVQSSGISFAFGAGGEPQQLQPIIQPKDWQDAVSVRLGGSVKMLDNALTLRGGTYYETSAIPNATYSVDVADGDKVGVGLGGAYTLPIGSTKLRFDLGYGLIYMFDRTIGDESIIHNENVAPPLLNPERRTRVAMGNYQVMEHLFTFGLNAQF